MVHTTHTINQNTIIHTKDLKCNCSYNRFQSKYSIKMWAITIAHKKKFTIALLHKKLSNTVVKTKLIGCNSQTKVVSFKMHTKATYLSILCITGSYIDSQNARKLMNCLTNIIVAA